MNVNETSVRLEDVASVGTRIRWGSILAGGTLALGLYFLLGILGAAVGLSISGTVNLTTLTTGAVLWALFTTCAALFVGGMVTSLFTVGENKIEAVVYGIIMWSFLSVLFVGLTAAGVSTGINAMVAASNTARAVSPDGWETTAREAGVSADQIAEWRGQLEASPDKAAKAEQLRKTTLDAATRTTWYGFLGMWLSMMAAAAGAFVGAGPTFRLVTVSTGERSGAYRRGPGVDNGQRGATQPVEMT